MRRGAILPLFLILPLAAMFGLDPSKSQPSHFLITFAIGVVFAAVFVSISWSGVKKRVDELSRISLSVVDDKLVWKSGLGQSELLLSKVTKVIVQERRGSIRSIVLKLDDGSRSKIEGYDRMDILAKILGRHLSSQIFETRKWLHL